MSKFAEYARRYLPSEIAGTGTAIAAAYISKAMADSDVAAAYAATLGENIGFYGTMFAREFSSDRRSAIEDHGSYTLRDMFRTARNLFIEFGPAETADSIFTRPLTMGIGINRIAL